MVGLLHSDAFNGDLERYPYAFETFGVTQVRLVIDFRAAVNHNITVLVWSEYENVYEINHLGGIKYNING